ncbi:MAG: BREX system Lon protease-like protein BrxL [Chloroflexi bacterium]|nr:BREX system Lon protease-like protein BrxL [Chloroflexota bacterium]
MNQTFKETFAGKVVNKRLTTNTGMDEFPRYVLEYLIDNYCKEETFDEDFALVQRRLRENFVHGAEAERIRHYIRENRDHTVIASLETRLVETEDRYWGTIGAINERFVVVDENLVKQYPMLLAGGMWGTIRLTYDETNVVDGKIRPFTVLEFTPFQIAYIDLNEFISKRRQFDDKTWLDILVNSFGLDPMRMSRREKLLYISRAIPLVENNHNMIELGPRETGKTYLFRNVSYYANVLSGGKATPAGLFINLNTGQVGLVGTRDAVVFDEIANTDFTDPRAMVSIMQGYMQDAKFSRGKKEILAFGSIVFVGNLDVQGKQPHEKYYHLFDPLPSYLQVEALIDRIHYYLPGWEVPKIGPASASQDYGFITDYFCEIMHELRRVDVLGQVKNRFELFDATGATQGITARDVRAIHKTLSGLLKLMYPHGEVADEQLEELLLLALEGRQRVRNQLHLMAPGEYYPIKIAARMVSSGKEVHPTLPEGDRKVRIELPSKPLVGEVTGLAVAGEQGVILRFEMQVTKGHGRIVPLGSIQRVMRESIEAAAQYIRAHYKELGISPDWHENFDVAVLATMMAMPKEGPSAGVTIVTGIVSALKGLPVRHDIAMTGEITIMGKVLAIGGVQAKLLAAIDAGVKTVILPAENEQDVRYLPDYMREKVELIYVSEIREALAAAGLEAATTAETSVESSLQRMIRAGENEMLEFKSTLQWDVHQNKQNTELRREVLKTIAAFLNSNGGTLLIGVDDNGVIFGLEKDLKLHKNSRDKFELTLRNLINDRIGVEFGGFVKVRFAEIEDKTVCQADVSPSPKPAYCDNEFFIRNGNQTRNLSLPEAMEYIRMKWG